MADIVGAQIIDTDVVDPPDIYFVGVPGRNECYVFDVRGGIPPYHYKESVESLLKRGVPTGKWVAIQ